MKHPVTKKEIDEMKYNIRAISAGSVIFVLIFSYIFHKYTVKHGLPLLSVFLVTALPIIAIIYQAYYNTFVYPDSRNRRNELNEIITEMNAETKFYQTIAFLLLGVGLIYAEFKKSNYLSLQSRLLHE